ncbi:hypothetical protein C2845_PM01G42410 [Panicum miliaceum]|uniref:Uncharacterized protein n=1 Tax=Panicum miliaceum TaxID=4540 RepID=A0A3L6TR89_PANMI|nr:hypothetical protein C2845_PM01G42410 [Panicum miliaceum]
MSPSPSPAPPQQPPPKAYIFTAPPPALQAPGVQPPSPLGTADRVSVEHEQDNTEKRSPVPDPNINPELVPRVGMSFKTQADAKKYFARYGQEVGFGVKLYRSRPESKWVNCIREGASKYYKPGQDQNLIDHHNVICTKDGMDNGQDESSNSDDGDEDGQQPAENTMTGLNTVGGGVNKKRGHPPGAKNKVKSAEAGEKAQEADQRKESMTSRRRGRPPGAKNKVQPVTTLQDEVEPETDRPRRRRLVHLADLDD